MSRKLAIILLIEDNPGDARLVREMLSEGTGAVYCLEWVENLEAGLRRIAQGGIDLVLLDLGLAESTGLETLRRLCAASRQLPAVVVMSGLGDDAVAEQAALEGAQDYLVKGQVDARLLRRSIRYAIERNEATVALRRAHDELESQIRERTAALASAIEALQRENTERKQAEEGLRNKEQQIQSLLDKSEQSRRSLLSLLEDQKRAGEMLLRLNRELQAISNCNQILIRAVDEQTLLSDVCRIISDQAGYHLVWVGYAEHDEAKTVRPVAWAGFDNGYVANAKLSWSDQTDRGRGPGGTAIRNGKIVYIQDFTTDPSMAPWRENALKRGYHSVIALPLKDETANVFGVLLIYSTQINAFTPDEIRLLEEMSGDLAFGIMVLRARIERKRAEEQLWESERRYRIAQAMGHVGNWEYNLQTSHFWGSDEAKRIYGFDPEQDQFSTEEVEKCIPERQRTHQALMDLIELGKPYNLEFEIVPRNSSESRVIASVAELQRDQHGAPLKVVGVIQDITERKRAEEAIQEGEVKYHRIIDTANEGIWMLGPDALTTSVNDRMAAMLGYSCAEMIGRPVSDFMSEEDASDHLKRMGNRNQGHSETYERRFRRKDGQFLWTMIIGVPIFDNLHQYQGAFGMITDITERKLAEKALHESEELFRTTVENVPVILYRLDSAGVFQLSVGAGLAKLGLKPGEVVGRSVFEFYKDFTEIVENHHYALAGKTTRFMTEIAGVVFDISLLPVLGMRGEVQAVVGIGSDVTERKRVEEALYEAQQVFRTLVENSPDIIARYDRNCRRTYVNPTYLKMTHIPQQELLATAPIQRSPLPADSAVVLQNLLSRVFDSGIAEAVDVIWSKTDAGEFWHNIYAFPEFDREGRVVSVMTISRDITERKQTEEELKRMNERFSLAADAARLGVWDWNIQKNELVWDDGMYALYGIKRGDFAGAYEAWLAGVHPDDRASSDEISKLARRGEREYDTEFRVVWPDGSIHYLKAYGKMIRDMDGSPLRMTGINFDITDRKQLEQDRLAHLQFVESMDRINRAIQGTNNLEQMMKDVLDVVISIFDCDRAFLMYPCDPDAVTWGVPMERNKPEYPGVLAQKLEIPMDMDVARTLRELLAADRPLKFGPETDHPLPDDVAQQFGFRSFMSMAIYPRVGKPWQFGIHQCSYPRVWTPYEEKLLEEIGRRLEDALTSLLSHRQLQESEQRFRLVFENSPVSIWEEDFSGVKMLFDDLRKAGVTDIAVYFAQHPEMVRQCAEKTKIVDVNQAALTLHGAASKDELLKDLAKTFTQESFDTFRQELVCLWNGESEMIEDAVVKTLAGEPRHVTVYFTVCPGYEQTFSKVLVSLVDITERKRAEEALFFVAQRGWESIAENFFDVLAKFIGEKLEMDYVFIDRIDEDPTMAETVALYVKGAIRPNIRYALKGTPCENVMGRRLCIYPRGIQQLFPEDTLLPGMSAESYIGIPLWDSTGRPIGLIAVIGSKPLSDDAPVTQLLQLVAIRAAAELERKRAEENIRRLNQELELRVASRTAQLEAVNKELEAFAYSVSHDLRAPLRGIDGFSQVLLDEYQDKVDQQGKDYLHRVRLAAQNMAQLIDDMLSLSRVTRGDMAIGPVDLSRAAREIADDLRQSQPDRRVEFVIGDGIRAQGDGRLLRVVLENLIRNAWKFTSKHPTARIEFGIQQQQEAQVYFVRDDGAGFDMNYAQKLFGAFQRLHTVKEFPGTGVGLATVQRIIHRHGGRVWAEGNVEKGATFYFLLPILRQGI